MPNSQNKFWWICEFGHSYEATPNNRNYGKVVHVVQIKRMAMEIHWQTNHPI